VVVRESTEGLFASRGKGVVEDDRIARETMVITRDVSERLFDFCFRLARRRRERGRPGRVTCVDKSNVFAAMAFFRRVFDERAALHPDIAADHHYVDAMALDMVRKPWEFDVLVMENMFGDILSDLGGGIVGGMGMAPCGEIGDDKGLFQPAHGSAPDIAGSGKANPTAMLLSTALMLDWLGQRHGRDELKAAAEALEQAVDRAFGEGAVRPLEFGGSDGTEAITRAVILRLA
jgi:3-isopropylmalate dehydrogenase